MFPQDTQILLVDDSEPIRENVRDELRKLGYINITEADDGKKGLFRLNNAEDRKMPIGLVICDWNMPNMKGIEMLKAVRAEAKWANLPFVLLTTESAINEVVQAVQAGVSSYIVKPLQPDVLAEKLKVVWQKHYPTSTAKSDF